MFWTKEICEKESLKYKTRSDFLSGGTSAYSRAQANRWLDEICSHMNKRQWTKEESKKESLKYRRKQRKFLTFGANLKALREAQGVTQKIFSEKMEISTQYLSDIENERTGVSVSKAKNYAIKLGVSKNSFVEIALAMQLRKIGLDDLEIKLEKRTNKYRPQNDYLQDKPLL